MSVHSLLECLDLIEYESNTNRTFLLLYYYIISSVEN